MGWERKAGGILHLRRCILSSLIVDKYREGKVQSTLERELNVPELVACQAVERTGCTKVVSDLVPSD